jgi:hypothetical protein
MAPLESDRKPKPPVDLPRPPQWPDPPDASHGWEVQAMWKLEVLNKFLEFLLTTVRTSQLLWKGGHMDQAIADAIAKLQKTALDASLKEVDDVKKLVQGGASTAEIVAALEQAETNIAAVIDQISVSAGNPSTPPTGGTNPDPGGPPLRPAHPDEGIPRPEPQKGKR